QMHARIPRSWFPAFATRCGFRALPSMRDAHPRRRSATARMPWSLPSDRPKEPIATMLCLRGTRHFSVTASLQSILDQADCGRAATGAEQYTFAVMRSTRFILPRVVWRTTVWLVVLSCGFAEALGAQNTEALATRTMRPVIRGREAAASSMRAQATEAARKILAAGGNAFDAAVAGQAALGITDFADNGVGSDAVVLVYVAREKKVYSVNAEPRAPKLATIEWYENHSGGKIPESDGLLSGGLPGAVDAWYVLLDRWGTMSFEQVLQPAIELAEKGFPLGESSAEDIAS